MNRKLYCALMIMLFSISIIGCNGSNYDQQKTIQTPSINTNSSTVTPSNPNNPVKSQPTQSNSQQKKQELIVYVTQTGHKYHRAGCQYLSKSQIPIELSKAISSGYSPCSVCDPPSDGNEATVSPPSNVSKPIETPAQENASQVNEKKATSQEEQKKEQTVYITKTGEKYHRAGCRYLKRSQIAISLSDAISAGYSPCSVCSPPR